MFLRAIAIYTYNNSSLNDCKRTHYVPVKSLSQLFSPDHLRAVQEQSLPAFIKEHKVGRPEKYMTKNHLHHYIIRFLDPKIILAVVSKTPIGYQELAHLYRNISIIYCYPESAGATLQNILENCNQFFTTQDLKIQDPKINNIDKGLKDLIQIMHINIEKVIDRGDKIDLLVLKANELKTVAVTFNKKSKEMNRCSC